MATRETTAQQVLLILTVFPCLASAFLSSPVALHPFHTLGRKFPQDAGGRRGLPVCTRLIVEEMVMMEEPSMRSQTKTERDGGSSFYFAMKIDPQAGVNLGFIRTLVRNQLLLGLSSWFSISGLAEQGTPLFVNTAFGIPELLLTLMASIPLAVMGYYISKSDNDLLSDLNTSTDILVLSMFGKNKSLATAAIVSSAVSLLTGLCEELSFRAILIPVLASRLAAPGSEPDLTLGLLAATLSFGAAHMSFGSSFKDNMVTLALQTVTGLWFGLVWILSGFNLFVAAGVHAFYDAFTLLETHVKVTGQIEYAEARAQEEEQSSSKGPEPAVWKRIDELVQQGVVDPGFRRYARTMFFLVDKDRNGKVDMDELSYAFKQFGRVLSSNELSQLFLKACGGAQADTLNLDQFVAAILELRNDPNLGAEAEVGRKKGFLGVR